MFWKTNNINTDEVLIKNLLERGVEDVFVKESLEKKLKSGKKLRVKLGFDPTGSKIHIGRAVVLRKLKAFQDLGHQIIFIVGDFTAKIGDPSDKLDKRPMLNDAQIKENLKDYKYQVGKILDISKCEFKFNSTWLSKLNFSDIAELAESFSVQQMVSRRNFKERIDVGKEISLREFLYPLMQGYDSVAVKSDIEIGGFDQLFNLKAGRIIQKHYSMPEQDVLTVQMLLGTDGRKMSTSWGNVINITDGPDDMFGKVMSIKDELISKYFLLCTDFPEDKIKEFEREITNGANPKDFKLVLAKEITGIYHGKEKAQKASANFEAVFSKKEVPEQTPEVFVEKNKFLADVVFEAGLVSSKSEYRRLLDEGAVSDFINKLKIDNPRFVIEKDMVVKVGSRRFLKITTKK